MKRSCFNCSKSSRSLGPKKLGSSNKTAVSLHDCSGDRVSLYKLCPYSNKFSAK